VRRLFSGCQRNKGLIKKRLLPSTLLSWLESRVEGRRNRRRPRTSWINNIKEWTNIYSHERVKRTAEDRSRRKYIIVNVLLQDDTWWFLSIRLSISNIKIGVHQKNIYQYQSPFSIHSTLPLSSIVHSSLSLPHLPSTLPSNIIRYVSPLDLLSTCPAYISYQYQSPFLASTLIQHHLKGDNDLFVCADTPQCLIVWVGQ